MTAATVDAVRAGLVALLTPSDDVALTDDLAPWLTEMMRRAGAQGVIGVRDDGLALVAPWGFDVSRITVPVAVAHLIDDAGHVTLIHNLEPVLSELLELR